MRPKFFIILRGTTLICGIIACGSILFARKKKTVSLRVVGSQMAFLMEIQAAEYT
jgi:hypothetical protein